MDAVASSGAKSSRTLTRFAWCLGLLPFTLATAAHVAGSTAQPAATHRERPGLVFDQYLVDLGEADASALVYGWFRFHNTTDRTIRVTELEPSCGCLQPRLTKREYRPGESGEFYVRVRTANELPGPKEYTIRFAYEDPEPREVTLGFKVTLPVREVSIEPKALVFYQLDGHETVREIVIRDHRATHLEILEATCPSDVVTVELGEPNVDERGWKTQSVFVTVSGELSADRIATGVDITTEDPEYAKLRVPLMIRGPEPEEDVPVRGAEAATGSP